MKLTTTSENAAGILHHVSGTSCGMVTVTTKWLVNDDAWREALQVLTGDPSHALLHPRQAQTHLLLSYAEDRLHRVLKAFETVNVLQETALQSHRICLPV